MLRNWGLESCTTNSALMSPRPGRALRPPAPAFRVRSVRPNVRHPNNRDLPGSERMRKLHGDEFIPVAPHDAAWHLPEDAFAHPSRSNIRAPDRERYGRGAYSYIELDGCRLDQCPQCPG